jgi:hypothetical protein
VEGKLLPADELRSIVNGEVKDMLEVWSQGEI